MALSGHAIHEAGETLWRHWRSSTCIDALGDGCRPRDRAEGYAIQAEVARLSGQPLAGWKIAATSVAGQRHLAVDAPLAGRLLANRQIPQGGMVPFAGNAMKVAEAEFAFQMAAALPRRSEPWSTDEVLAAVGTRASGDRNSRLALHQRPRRRGTAAHRGHRVRVLVRHWRGGARGLALRVIWRRIASPRIATRRSPPKASAPMSLAILARRSRGSRTN